MMKIAMKNFIGREYYVQKLQSLEDRKVSKLSAIYGRRRVGKTTLVEYALKNYSILKFEGLEHGDDEHQKQHFISTLYRTSGEAAHRNMSAKSSWSELLITLSEYLGNNHKVVFFDEFQWMACEQRHLVSEFKYVWDNFFLKNNNVHIILCGSISSFIVKKVIRSKALYGRIDNIIELNPLTVVEVYQKYYRDSHKNLNILDYYLAVGGIPKYLEYLEPDQSLMQNMQRLCFKRDGVLFNEPKKLFISHFGRTPHYQKIVDYLARAPRSPSSKLIKNLRLSSGGRLSEYLENLVLSGFIEEYSPIQVQSSKSKLKRYSIKDYFLRFYYNFVYPNSSQIEQQSPSSPQTQLVDMRRFSIWQGLAFEHMCKNSSSIIAKILGFDGIQYNVGSWFKRADQKNGFQIDLIFIRADGVVTLVECKYLQNIKVDTIKQFQKKVERIQEELNPKHVQKVLVTVYPASFSKVNTQYFDKIIEFKDFLE